MAKTALEAPRLSAFAMDPDDLVIVGLDEDVEDGHPLIDDRAEKLVVNGLVENVLKYGVLESVLARKNKEGLPEVVDGRQRVQAAREANKILRKKKQEPIKVPVILIKGDDQHLLGAAIATNELRKDDDPMVKAEKLAHYLATPADPKKPEETLPSDEDAAVTFGCTVTTIRSWKALDNAIGAVKKAVRAGDISASAAGKIAKLDKGEQEDALKVLLESEGKPTTKKAARVAKNKKGDKGPKYDPPGKRFLKQIAEADAEKIGLSNVVRQTILWVLGETPETNVPGLKGAIDKLEKVLDEELKDVNKQLAEVGKKAKKSPKNGHASASA